VGLYQINVIVPPEAPNGMGVPVYIQSGHTFSNRVEIAIQ